MENFTESKSAKTQGADASVHTSSGQVPNLYVHLDDLPGNAVKAAVKGHPVGAPRGGLV